MEGVPTREIHGELHTGIGQEGLSAGIADHFENGDAAVSTHRNHLHALARGVDPYKLMAEIFEKETGLCRGRGGHMHPFDPLTNFSATGIVGSALPVALGYAYANKLNKNDNIAVAFSGDGAANTGAFHETLNLAAAWKLPLLIVVENNDYAISVKFDDISATPTIAERAAAYCAWGRRVDGINVEEVFEVSRDAFKHVRDGNGPAILEATCCRFRGHYEGDHDTYRSRQERKEMLTTKDPIKLAREKIIDQKIMQSNALHKLEASS